MKAGQLRHRVTIQQSTVTQDVFGEPDEVWSDVATVWAAVEPVAGLERYVNSADQRLAEATTRIRMRYRDGIDERMRVYWSEEARTFDIRAVLNQWGRMRELHLMCREINPG